MIEIIPSIDLTGVKKLTIPEGIVKKISVDGIPVWEEVTNEVTYTPIDYIQFTGVQDIDTGIICNQNTKIEIQFTRENSESRWLYGVRNSNSTASVTAYLSSSGAWRFGGAYRNYSIPLNEMCTMVIDKNGTIRNGTSNNYASGSVGTFTANGTLTLGSARNNNGTYGSPQFIGKIYSFKMYDGSTLVADYVPSISSDGEYGFYDNVSKEFKLSRSQPFNNETASFAINTLELDAFNEVELSEIGQPAEIM